MKAAIKLTAMHSIVQQIIARALTADPAVAAVFFEHSAHVASFELRGFAGGWARGRSADFEARIYLDAADSLPAAAAMLEALEAFLASAPALVAQREAAAKQQAAAEREAFAAAVQRHAQARRAGASADEVQALALTCLRLMDGMKAETRGLWWDEQHGTWGIGDSPWQDDEPSMTGAICAGPHA